MTKAGPLLAFFTAAFALTWLCFGFVATRVPFSTPAGYLLVLLGAWSPALAAIGVTARTEGRAVVS